MRRLTRRRRLSLTSLIDVIFLLLLFFMLTSTFTRFADIPLATGGSGGAAAPGRPLFLQLGADSLRLNGSDLPADGLADALRARLGPAQEAPVALLIALAEDTTAQRLTDILAELHRIDGLRATVLGDGS
jgi:biopolymer transport protein ExbD